MNNLIEMAVHLVKLIECKIENEQTKGEGESPLALRKELVVSCTPINVFSIDYHFCQFSEAIATIVFSDIVGLVFELR